jgi:hypothetical protein
MDVAFPAARLLPLGVPCSISFIMPFLISGGIFSKTSQFAIGGSLYSSLGVSPTRWKRRAGNILLTIPSRCGYLQACFDCV